MVQFFLSHLVSPAVMPTIRDLTQGVRQLADASGSSAQPAELDPNDVPAWRTKMCKNRIAILKVQDPLLPCIECLVTKSSDLACHVLTQCTAMTR